MLKSNIKRQEDCLPFVEFVYNKSVHSTTKITPFEVVYGRNLLTPVDLMSRPIKEKDDFEASKRVEFEKKLHENTRLQLERKAAQYKAQANKYKKNVQFEKGDLVWLHLRKERFPQQCKSKLESRGDGPYMVVQKVGSNAYKIDLPQGKYGVHSNFNVVDLSLFVPLDDSDDESRTIRGQVEENDARCPAMTPKDIDGKMKIFFDGPITRSRAKKIQEATQALLIRLEALMERPKNHHS